MTIKALAIGLATFAATSLIATSAIAGGTTTHYGSARALSFGDATPQASVQGKSIVERSVTNSGSATKLRFDAVVADAGAVEADRSSIGKGPSHDRFNSILRRNYEWR